MQRNRNTHSQSIDLHWITITLNCTHLKMALRRVIIGVDVEYGRWNFRHLRLAIEFRSLRCAFLFSPLVSWFRLGFCCCCCWCLQVYFLFVVQFSLLLADIIVMFILKQSDHAIALRWCAGNARYFWLTVQTWTNCALFVGLFRCCFKHITKTFYLQLSSEKESNEMQRRKNKKTKNHRPNMLIDICINFQLEAPRQMRYE